MTGFCPQPSVWLSTGERTVPGGVLSHWECVLPLQELSWRAAFHQQTKGFGGRGVKVEMKNKKIMMMEQLNTHGAIFVNHPCSLGLGSDGAGFLPCFMLTQNHAHIRRPPGHGRCCHCFEQRQHRRGDICSEQFRLNPRLKLLKK